MTGRRTTFIVLLLCALASPASGQPKQPRRSGGRFDTLRPEQQRLIVNWAGEYALITGKELTPAESYDRLSASTRATFEAVTQALLNTALTAHDGSSLGTGLDLIELVEAVHGQLPGFGGDRQFRLYALLKPDALDRLSRSEEFKRRGDNDVFHAGYPINFRQRGGVPALHVSITATGRRADIDIDYRSGRPPFVLFNGHWRSSNSNVMVDRNFNRFVSRWGGLTDWWNDLMSRLALPQFDEGVKLAFGVEIPALARVRSNRPVSDAAFDFYRKWLVDGAPEQAMGYLSVRSYPCLAEYGAGESVDSGLAALRILEHMRRQLAAVGRSADLSEAIRPVATKPPGAVTLRRAHRALFTVRRLTATAACAVDCVLRHEVTLAEPLPYGLGEPVPYYAVSTRLLKGPGDQSVLTQVWTTEAGVWKVISWFFENGVADASGAVSPGAVARPAGPPGR